jgi:outer membrane protein assembly factor BamB
VNARIAIVLVLTSGCLTTFDADPPPIAGVVFADLDGDGRRQPGEPGVGGVRVAFERATFTTTDEDGAFGLDPGEGEGSVWARVPAGFRPGPVWRSSASVVELPLVPLSEREATSPLAFVVAADSHVPGGLPGDPWDGGDLVDVLAQATGTAEPPRFVTILGDLTTGAVDEQFARLDEAVAAMPAPWVPVPGNHDWYDGGAAYRRHLGLENYSFEIGELHVVVWNTNMGEAAQLAFLQNELADVADARTVIALGHHSPSDEVADAMAALGVDYLFSGHWHANRRVQRGRMIEWSTQPLVMGAIDQSPPGYRIVTFPDDGGPPTIEFRARLAQEHLALVAPHATTCVPERATALLVAAALDASEPEVTVRIDCGPPVPLAPRGGWVARGVLPVMSPGTHSLVLEARSASGRRAVREAFFEVCRREEVELVPREWPQLGGGPAHLGSQPAALVPPLVVRWATPVGANVSLGSPVVAGNLAIVAITDHGGGDRGGLVALDLATGTLRWRYLTPAPAVGAAAIADGIVVVATKNGEVHAVALVDGQPLWRRDVAHGLSALAASLWAPPVIAADHVFVAVPGRLTALDLPSGRPVWSRDVHDTEETWLGSLAAVTVADGTALAAFDRTTGFLAADARTGLRLWSLRDARVAAVNATPVAQAGTVYVINAAGRLSAIRIATGEVAWGRELTPGANDWSYAVTAAPVVAQDTLFVPTTWGELIAVDVHAGTVRWRASAPAGPLSFTHYRSTQGGFPSSPVVTGNVIWSGGLDGTLFARSVVDGRIVWATSLGAPITSAPAPVGDGLVVATFDGTVRLLVPGTPATPGRARHCPPAAVPEPR